MFPTKVFPTQSQSFKFTIIEL